MTRKRVFIDKKNADRFRLLPTVNGANDLEQPNSSMRFIPSASQLEEQHKYGIFFDDDYDYLKHLRSRDDKAELIQVDEKVAVATGPRSVEPLPSSFLFGEFNPSSATFKNKKSEITDYEIETLFNEAEEMSDLLEDNFIELAGGPLETAFSVPQARDDYNSDDDDDDRDNQMFDQFRHKNDFSMEESDAEDKTVVRNPVMQRDIDEGFESFLESAYNPENIGGLEPDDPRMRGVLDPNDPRIIKLISGQKGEPEYDNEFAKEDVRKRLRHWGDDNKGLDDTELIEVDEGARKRLKWDCESFASQYTNIYNRPAQIREPQGKLSKRALRRIDQLSKKEDLEEEDEVEMMDDGESVTSTISTFRPKNETVEERRIRKSAVKEAQRQRRIEKKQNQTAFAEEARRLKIQKLGQQKAKPLS